MKIKWDEEFGVSLCLITVGEDEFEIAVELLSGGAGRWVYTITGDSVGFPLCSAGSYNTKEQAQHRSVIRLAKELGIKEEFEV